MGINKESLSDLYSCVPNWKIWGFTGLTTFLIPDRVSEFRTRCDRLNLIEDASLTPAIKLATPTRSPFRVGLFLCGCDLDKDRINPYIESFKKVLTKASLRELGLKSGPHLFDEKTANLIPPPPNKGSSITPPESGLSFPTPSVCKQVDFKWISF